MIPTSAFELDLRMKLFELDLRMKKWNFFMQIM